MELVLVPLSIGAAVVPILCFLLLLWWMDRYDREPFGLFALVFLWGAGGAVVFAMASSTLAVVPLEFAIGAQAAARIAIVILAPLVEEPTKAAVLLLLPFSKHFDNTTDGFVYGGAAGLGFAMTENLLYFTGAAAEGDPATWIGTVLVRTLYSAVMHAAATGLVGAAIGFALLRPFRVRVVALVVGLLLAMTMHGVWNGLLTADEVLGAEGALFGVDLLVFPLEVLVVLALFQFCLWDERRTLLHVLEEEAALGILPAAHVPVLCSWLRRSGRRWLPPGVPHAAYVRTATTLAFRKHQARASPGARAAPRVADVERLRSEVRRLLAAST